MFMLNKVFCYEILGATTILLFRPTLPVFPYTLLVGHYTLSYGTKQYKHKVYNNETTFQIKVKARQFYHNKQMKIDESGVQRFITE